MAALESHESLIRNLISQGKSHEYIGTILRVKYNVEDGSSARSVRRFCSERGLRKGGRLWSDAELATEVQHVVLQTGPTTGRRMCTGYLAAKGIRASERRVGKLLAPANPQYHEERQRGCRNLNPSRYRADYFGEKLHLDQNEKLVMFGVTYVIAVDGYSSKVVAGAVMPIKNNITIYDWVYRKAVLDNGMWTQIRVDKGKEFFLILYVQEKNMELRPNTEKPPYRQTTSTQNHRVERMWVEVNNRVSYPVKNAVIEMEESGDLDMTQDLHRFCVSQMLLKVCDLGLQRFISGWNFHRIQGRGVPNEVAGRHDGSAQVDSARFPPGETVAEWYFQDIGSHLTQPGNFAPTPFPSENAQRECERHFVNVCPPVDFLLDSAINRNFQPLQDAIRQLINITTMHTQ